MNVSQNNSRWFIEKVNEEIQGDLNIRQKK